MNLTYLKGKTLRSKKSLMVVHNEILMLILQINIFPSTRRPISNCFEN